MTSAVRQKVKKTPHIAESVWNLKTIVGLIIVLAFVTLLMFGISKLKAARVAALPPEFEGQIVEKWAGYDHVQEGSYPYFRLVVEIPGPQRLTVPVTREIYEEAQVGLRLRRSAKGLEVISERKN